MNLARTINTALLTLVALAASAGPARAWDLVLPDTVVARDGALSLAELAEGPVPAVAADLMICGAGRPGTAVEVSRAGVLRRLVSAGLAREVRMRGPVATVVIFAGRSLAPLELQESVRRMVQPLVPPAQAGAPASWIELDVPRIEKPVAGSWQVAVDRTEPLKPGRNLVRCEVRSSSGVHGFTVTVVLHAFGEAAVALQNVPRGSVLMPKLFTWSWQDLGAARRDLVVGRESLAGTSAGRTITAGNSLRRPDLEATPVVRAGDQVELRVVRGSVAVSVQAIARQNGALGQTIPVRNELTGRLRNARVTAPGIVEWRN
ncbi:MAG: flagellar basal body P-ring formation protein FlgA [bacterium]|nr:flagellar basal body P-ring formation protein FlgA [bacterium]